MSDEDRTRSVQQTKPVNPEGDDDQSMSTPRSETGSSVPSPADRSSPITDVECEESTTGMSWLAAGSLGQLVAFISAILISIINHEIFISDEHWWTVLFAAVIGTVIGSGLAGVLTRPSDRYRAVAGAFSLWVIGVMYLVLIIILEVTGKGDPPQSAQLWILGYTFVALVFGGVVGVAAGRIAARLRK